MPKGLSLWILAQLYYINSSTFSLFFHVGLPLTCIYPTISPSLVNHYLFLDFETSFPWPWISPTSSPLFMRFFFLMRIIHGPFVRHPWTRVCYPHTHIHGNLVHLYSWEPCTHHSSFFDLALLATLFVKSFFLRSLCRFYWACLMRCKFVWAPITRTPSLLQLQKGSCSPYIRKMNSHNLATLPHWYHYFGR